MTDHSQRIQDIKSRDALYKMYDALKAADVEYSALSTTGINIFAADRKSIDACSAALDKAAQWDRLCRNLRHWQEECGKLHSQLDASLSRERALREALSACKGYMLNGVIDLQTGTKKQTTIDTLNGGIRIIDAALQGKD